MIPKVGHGYLRLKEIGLSFNKLHYLRTVNLKNNELSELLTTLSKTMVF